MEIFTERLIRKNLEAKDICLAVAIFLAGVMVSLAALVFLSSFALIIIAAVFYGIYHLLSHILVVEYEYILTNMSLDIDKITGKSKRVRLKSMNIKELSSVSEGTEGKADAEFFFCAGRKTEGLYSLFSENKGRTEKIVINPNESMLKAFEFYLGSRFVR